MELSSSLVVVSEAGGGQIGIVYVGAQSRRYPLPGTFFVTSDASRSLVYATSSGHGGSVHTFRLDPDGGLTPVHVLEDVGAFPCHLAVSPDGSMLVIADYEAGDVVVVGLVDGMPSAEPRRIALPLPDREPPHERQTKPYPHYCLFDSSAGIVVTSLGGDRLWRLDLSSMRIVSSTVCSDGAGPRHLARDLTGALWCSNELDSTVTRFDMDLRPTHVHSLLPKGWSGNNYPSDIAAVEGRWVVAANRGADTLVVYDALRPDAGRVAEVACGGAWPAQLMPLDESRLLVANTRTDSVRLFTFGENGLPMPDSRELAVPRPLAMCLVG